MLADGTRIPIQTETIFRDGASPAGPAASQVGATAVVGGIIGGTYIRRPLVAIAPQPGREQPPV